jgi:phosphotransferase system IIA component
MDVIINLWHEQLHDIIISTKSGRKLRMHINQDASAYRLYGEFFESTDKTWYLVEFSPQQVSDPEVLLKTCLDNLHHAMVKKSDSITDVHNTCNEPIVSAEKQKAMLADLGINAQVRVN